MLPAERGRQGKSVNVSLVFTKQTASQSGYPVLCAFADTSGVRKTISQETRYTFSKLAAVFGSPQRLLQDVTRRSPACPMRQQGLEPYGVWHKVKHLSAGLVSEIFQHVVKTTGRAACKSSGVARAASVPGVREVTRCRARSSHALPGLSCLGVNLKLSICARYQTSTKDNSTTWQQDLGFDCAPVSHALGVDDTWKPIISVRLNRPWD